MPVKYQAFFDDIPFRLLGRNTLLVQSPHLKPKVYFVGKVAHPVMTFVQVILPTAVRLVAPFNVAPQAAAILVNNAVPMALPVSKAINPLLIPALPAMTFVKVIPPGVVRLAVPSYANLQTAVTLVHNAVPMALPVSKTINHLLIPALPAMMFV